MHVHGTYKIVDIVVCIQGVN